MNKVDRSEDRQYRSINRCVGHHLIDCQWVQIIDLTLLLTTPHQTQLLEMFPFLRKYVDKPQDNIDYTLSWIDLEKEVQQMDPTIFKISRISRSQRTRSNKKQTCSIPISNKYIIPNRHNRTEKLTPSCDPKKELSRRNRRDDWPAGPLREIHAPSKHILCQCRGTMQVHCGPGAAASCQVKSSSTCLLSLREQDLTLQGIEPKNFFCQFFYQHHQQNHNFWTLTWRKMSAIFRTNCH